MLALDLLNLLNLFLFFFLFFFLLLLIIILFLGYNLDPNLIPLQPSRLALQTQSALLILIPALV